MNKNTVVKCNNILCGHLDKIKFICKLQIVQLSSVCDNGYTYVMCTSFTPGADGNK